MTEAQKSQKAMRRAESLKLNDLSDEPRAWLGSRKFVTGLRLVAYTVSMMVFGMICSALGPSIPWLAENADVSPETLGYLPAAQAVMCIISGLASSVVALLPRRYHHCLLCVLTLWLAGFFALLPAASSSIFTLILVYAFQVLPRPWIGQMTNLLVSQLFDDPSISSAAQSLNQGGFALGCVSMVLLEEYASEAFGGAAVFYMAGGFTALSAFLFLVLPRLEDQQAEKEAGSSQRLSISAFSVAAACLSVLAVGVEVACGTWLITAMSQTGFDSSVASSSTVVFWILFAMSRLVLAPVLCKIFRPRPSLVVILGATVSAVGCIPAAIWPLELGAILVGVSGVAVGAGPSYSMIISMAKERRPTGLNSIDSAMFSIASSLGAGGVPFFMSRILKVFGSTSFFPTLLVMSAILVVMTLVLANMKTSEGVEVKTEVSKAQCSKPVVPGIIWTYWEQRWQHAPALCRACAKSWEVTNPEVEVRKISAADIPDLVPELSQWKRFWELPPTQRSDLLRLAVLEKLGGIWVDATLFSSSPIMPWLEALKAKQTKIQNGDGNEDEFFFVFDRSDSKEWPHDPFLQCDLLISSWFIVSTPKHRLTSKWFTSLCKEFTKTTVKYFTIHDTFRNILEDSTMRKFYEEIPKVSARHPHLLEFEVGFSTCASEEGRGLLQKALLAAPMQKLTHKVLQQNFLLALIHPSLQETTMLKTLLSLNGNASDYIPCLCFSGTSRTNAELISEENKQRSTVHTSWQISVHIPTGIQNLGSLL